MAEEKKDLTEAEEVTTGPDISDEDLVQIWEESGGTLEDLGLADGDYSDAELAAAIRDNYDVNTIDEMSEAGREVGTPLEVVDTSDGAQPDEVETLWAAVDALDTDKKAAFMNKLKAADPEVKEAKIEDKNPWGQDDSADALEAALTEKVEAINNSRPQSGNALAKLIGSFRI